MQILVSQIIISRTIIILIFILGVGTAQAQNVSRPPPTMRLMWRLVGHWRRRSIRLPVEDKFWWDQDWYANGKMPVPGNFELQERTINYTNPADGTDVPGFIVRPKGGTKSGTESQGKYPGIIFQHGRRGLDEFTRNLARRMAAQGFVVLAPDLYQARFISKFPIEHLPATETDLNAGVDFLLKQPDVSTSRICLYSHTRGGYYALKVAVSMKRQEKANRLLCDRPTRIGRTPIWRSRCRFTVTTLMRTG